jgi:hypothetical protein
MYVLRRLCAIFQAYNVVPSFYTVPHISLFSFFCRLLLLVTFPASYPLNTPPVFTWLKVIELFKLYLTSLLYTKLQ